MKQLINKETGKPMSFEVDGKAMTFGLDDDAVLVERENEPGVGDIATKGENDAQGVDMNRFELVEIKEQN